VKRSRRWLRPFAPLLAWRPPIALALGIGLVLGTLVAMGTALGIVLSTATRNTQDLLRGQATAIVQSLRLQVISHLSPAGALVETVAQRIEDKEIGVEDSRALLAMLQAARAAAPQIVGDAFIRSDMRLTGSGAALGDEVAVLESWSEDPGVQRLVAIGPTRRDRTWFWTSWIETLSTSAITAARAVFVDDEFVGVVTAVVSVQALSGFLSELDQTENFTAFILYGEDSVLAHPALSGGSIGVSSEKPFPRLAELNDVVLAQLWSEEAEDLDIFEGSEIEGRLFELNTGTEVVLMQRIDGFGELPLIVGAHFPLAEAGDAIDRLQTAFLAAGGVLLVTLFGLVLISSRVSRPIRALAEAARSVETLELEKAPFLTPGAFRETAAAASAFNGMLRGLADFSTYVPRELVRQLVRRGQTDSELRELTVMFTDIVGFTPLAAALEPAALAEFLNRHFALVAQPIEKSGGTLDKYIGDCVMAFWGAPEEQPDHAARALAAAIAICRLVTADNAERRQRGEQPVRMRIGLVSGPVVVGNVGAPGRINYTLIGETVNTAQRLEQLGRDYQKDDEDCVILTSRETAASLPPGLALVQPLGLVQLAGLPRETDVVRICPLAAGDL